MEHETSAIKHTRYYAKSTSSKRKREMHLEPVPDHRKNKKLKQLPSGHQLTHTIRCRG